MLETLRSSLQRFAKFSALNWLLIIADASRFHPSARPTEEQISGLVTGIEDASEDNLTEMADLLQRAYEEEEKRSAKIESKAITLMGVTGIAFSFVIGFAQFFGSDLNLPGTIQFVLTVLYLFIGVSLLATVLIAKRAIEIGKFVYRRFASHAFFELPRLGRSEFYREYTSNLLSFVQHNHAVNNDKATHVIAAQNWFRNAIVLFFFLLMLLSFSPYLDNSSALEPEVIIIVTATPVSTPPATPTAVVP